MNTNWRVERGAMTQAVIGAALATNKPIGDAEMPRGGTAGWRGAPNADGSNFVPYAVVVPMSASLGSGPLGDPQGDVNIPYALTSYGVTRQQCEWMADTLRQAIAAMTGESVTMYSGTSAEHTRIIQYVMDTQIGQVQRVADTDPAYFGQTDIVTLWTTR